VSSLARRAAAKWPMLSGIREAVGMGLSALVAYKMRVPLLAKILGTVVATRKDPKLEGSKLLLARPVDPAGKLEGGYLVAVDTVDAGVGETVLIVSGSSARMAAGMKDCPVDAAIVGIVDHVEVTE